MNVKVLGSGCANCDKLTGLVREVVSEMAMDAKIEKVEGLVDIMKYGITATPGLVIDEKVVSTGRVPTKAEVTTMLVNAQLAAEQAVDE
ncbi:MAG: thioredoxin family protein [Anaerolineae bacterium]